MSGNWLAEGRPRLGTVLLLLAGFSLAMLAFEGMQSPADMGLPKIRGLDKLLHFAAHFWVTALMFWGTVLMGRPAALRRRLLQTAIVVLVLDGPAGLGIELVQKFSGQGRVFDWLDFAANLAGSITAIALGWMLCIHFARPSTTKTEQDVQDSA